VSPSRWLCLQQITPAARLLCGGAYANRQCALAASHYCRRCGRVAGRLRIRGAIGEIILGPLVFGWFVTDWPAFK